MSIVNTTGPVRGPERFAGQAGPSQERPSALQALGAGLALLVLVAGIPLALILLTGPPPVPHSLPTRDTLTQPITTDTLIGVLRVVVWLAWLQFTACVLVEAASLVRGGGLPRPVPLSGRSQALARALVGTFLIGASFLGTSGAAQAVAPAAPVAATAVSHTVVQDQRDDAAQAADQAQAPASHETQRMEHVPGVPSEMTDVIGHKVTIVQPPEGRHHDNLWDIAERTLGDGRRWKEIYELNKGRVQPDQGQLVLGRLIQPGWVLILPGDASGATVNRVHAVADGSVAPHQGGDRAEQSGHERQGDSAAEETRSDRGILPVVGGGLFGAVLLGALLAERRRRRGRTPDDAEIETEVALRVGADVDRTDWLDQALRGLSAACRSERTPLPQAYAVVLTDDAVELKIAPPMPQAVTPWSAHDGGRTWRLERASFTPGESGHAPYPGLVCVGRDDSGADVLVDLEAAGGIVSISGSSTVATEVVSALAVQLATSPWGDDQVVHGYHLAPALAEIAGATIETVDDVDALVARWAANAPRAAEDVLTGRLGRHPGVPPEYLVLGSTVGDAETGARLGELARGGSRGIGVLAAQPLDGARWRLTVDEAGRMTIPLLEIEVDAVRLGASAAEEIAALFARARTEEPYAPGRATLPTTSRGSDDVTWSTASVRIGVLGALELRTEGRLDASRLELATEVATFLALQPAPVHASVVGASIWPRGVTPEVRDATIERVRDWLGADSSGGYLLRQTDDGRLFLADEVGVDWHAFVALVQRSRGAAVREERDLLGRALRLVRGPFLSRRPTQRYAWLPRTRLEQQVADVVVDTAHRLFEITVQDDPGGAAQAARAGLRLAPIAQVLWRDLLRAEHEDPDGPDAAAVVEEMVVSLDAAGAALESETEALIAELLPEHVQEA
ncbi:bacterial transcriptional activator domain-containing protein [Nocardioides nematodiphilus]|uniref:bacterial transcriptional activator domain-containing protein n=1 Tax=Nocardioides nematodiphilus TaxID=2849669 RepID=UPI001CD9DE6D|nr:bacterial transcriptional activator domain-containing protein [Nocardioides nematodiphilus]MCA1983987.1 hypothetical protein [Nocardioides nematodiphilus]